MDGKGKFRTVRFNRKKEGRRTRNDRWKRRKEEQKIVDGKRKKEVQEIMNEKRKKKEQEIIDEKRNTKTERRKGNRKHKK